MPALFFTGLGVFQFGVGLMKSLLIPLSWLLTLQFANAFTVGNLLVTSGPGAVREYTTSGVLVSTISVPAPPVAGSSDGRRDIVLDRHGAPHLFNGVFNAYLSSQDHITGLWSHRTLPGFSIVNGVTYGKLAIFEDIVFATDMSTANGQQAGIVKYDLSTGQLSRFAEPARSIDAPIDVTIGYDGLLYALEGTGSPSGRSIAVYDPISLDFIRRLQLPSSARDWSSIAVDQDGNIYLNLFDAHISKFSPTLQLLGSASYTHSTFTTDLLRLPDGRLVLSGRDGRITILDDNLNELSTFQTFGLSSNNCFVGSVQAPVPEVNVAITMVIGLFGLLIRRKRRWGHC